MDWEECSGTALGDALVEPTIVAIAMSNDQGMMILVGIPY
jgi:hypothetical protein